MTHIRFSNNSDDIHIGPYLEVMHPDCVFSPKITQVNYRPIGLIQILNLLPHEVTELSSVVAVWNIKRKSVLS